MGYQIEKIRACVKAGEGRLFPTVDQLKSEQCVKFDSTPHVLGCERHRTDAFDHDPSRVSMEICLLLLFSRIRLFEPAETSAHSGIPAKGAGTAFRILS